MLNILKHIVNLLLNHVEGMDEYKVARRFTLVNIFSWLWPIFTILLITVNFYVIHSTNSDDSKTVIENLVGIATLSAILAIFLYKIIYWISAKYLTLLFWPRVWIWVFILSYLAIAGGIVKFFIPALVVNLDWLLINTDNAKIPDINPILAIKGFLVVCTLILLIMITVKFISASNNRNQKREPIAKIHEHLKVLHDRCNAQVTKEDQLQESFAISMSSLFNRHQKIYPIANPREIENELIQIIDKLNEYYQYIFVFDELDKVDPEFENVVSLSDPSGERLSYLNDLRERRHLITNILASLKYFVNEAEAKFIFIAGREMFEAALADISDRQSSISSIFHKVIYVDSFLKDRSNGDSHVSPIGGLVETYLRSILLKETHSNSDFFTDYYKSLKKESFAVKSLGDTDRSPKKTILTDQEARKVIFILQNFLGYLVYRSNGSPKKITKLFEEYIRQIDLSSDKNELKRSIVFCGSDPAGPEHYLCFSYLDQYKLGYTAYLFQPFLTMNSSFMKRYSDNTLVSISYLIDNLIKFHPFAFSAQNLELLPEILATSRTPISRPFLEDLVSFLAENHIRRTESGLYEYKFYDRTHNEITFISKLFEDEAAAFNFTLDETFSIKAHLQTKIRHLRATHSGSSLANPIVSIIFLNRLLGDAHFQDEEYQDAIVSYQDALQVLNIDDIKYANQTTSFILLKLKLGLTYEKIKAYEFALSHYASVIERAAELLNKKNGDRRLIYRELLVMIMQAYLATLYLQEKLQEGITFQKIKLNIDLFIELLGNFKHDYQNRDIIEASYFSGIGTALYFKNMVLPQQVNVKGIRTSVHPSFEAGAESTNSLLKCFSERLGNDFIQISEGELQIFRNPKLIQKDARISFSTYLYYKKSIKILLGSKQNGLAVLLGDCASMISFGEDEEITFRNLQHTKRLSNLGHSLAKMGDYILPLIQTHPIPVHEALGCFYFDDKSGLHENGQMLAAKNKMISYFKDLNGLAADFRFRIQPRLVIHLYFLAAVFYLEAGTKQALCFS